ncbi:MAG: hypothetical protein ACOYJE_02445 [Bacteroidaceae bacterium]|jgi:hypothetical protein
MRLKSLFFSLSGIAVLCSTACSNEEIFNFQESELTGGNATKVSTVTIETGEITHLGKDTLMLRIEGGDDARVKGIVYSETNQMPTIRVSDGCSRVIMTADSVKRTGFEMGATYYMRAFGISINEDRTRDTTYGSVKTVTLQVQPSSVTTYPVTNRVRVAAIVMGAFKELGDVKEYGAVLSREINPTIDDTKVVASDMDETTHEFGVFFDHLEPLTMYHTRTYAIQGDGNVVYGNDRIFQTTRGGQVRWAWASNAAGAQAAITDGVSAYDRITEAMDSAMYYYNNYSNLIKSISVEYNEGVPTADCNINAWMRFGAVTRYQWVGTAQHEISHAMGVGTGSNWQALIQYSTVREWSGPIANQALKVMLKDMTQVIHGDTQHFWNGGINQREEVTNGTTNSYGVTIRNADMLKANAMILNGMREDGLTNY